MGLQALNVAWSYGAVQPGYNWLLGIGGLSPYWMRMNWPGLALQGADDSSMRSVINAVS